MPEQQKHFISSKWFTHACLSDHITLVSDEEVTRHSTQPEHDNWAIAQGVIALNVETHDGLVVMKAMLRGCWRFGISLEQNDFNINSEFQSFLITNNGYCIQAKNGAKQIGNFKSSEDLRSVQLSFDLSAGNGFLEVDGKNFGKVINEHELLKSGQNFYPSVHFRIKGDSCKVIDLAGPIAAKKKAKEEDTAKHAELFKFLSTIGLDELAPVFKKNDMIELDMIMELTESDLKDMNLSMGQVKKIMKQIKDTKQEASQEKEVQEEAKSSAQDNAAVVGQPQEKSLTEAVQDLSVNEAASDEFPQLKQFLDSIDLGKLTPNFVDNEVTTLDNIKELTADDLKDELKIPLGPRKTILKAIAALGQATQGTCALEESIAGFGSVTNNDLQSGIITHKN